MAKLSLALIASLVAGASAFAPVARPSASSALKASEQGYWDPLGLYELGSGEAFDTFPNMFPAKQYLDDSEKKHGRMAMLAWTGIWATHQGGLGLGLHFDGFPQAEWTEAFGVFANDQPVWFGAILAFIGLAEGESVGHSGDNFRGKSTKTSKAAGDLNFDYLGIKKKASAEKLKRYDDVETKNGRAAMIAMASMWAYEAIPGSVPIMDLLN